MAVASQSLADGSAHPMPAPATDHLPALHALRAIAALMVLACHFETAVYLAELNGGSMDKSSFVYEFFSRAGIFGVDLFFYLSGFIMVYTTRRNTSDDAWGFLLKRVLRIFPVFWLCLFGYWQLIKPETPFVTILECAALLPRLNGNPPFFGLPLLGVAWSLTYEMLFYALFALALRLSSSRVAAGSLVTGFLFLMVLALQWMIAGAFTLDPNQSPITAGSDTAHAMASLMANPLFLQFAIGALCGQGFLALRRRPKALSGQGLRALAILLFAATPIFYWMLPHEQHGWWGMATPAMTAFGGGLIADYLRESQRIKFVDLLGDLSYGIYLVHQPVIEVVTRWVPDYWPRHDGLMDFLLLAAVVFAVSYLMHVTVELPAMAWARRLIRQWPDVGGALPSPWRGRRWAIEWRGFVYYAMLLPLLARRRRLGGWHRLACRFKQRQVGDLSLPAAFAGTLPADTPEFRRRYALFEVLRDADAFFDGQTQNECFAENFVIRGIEHLAALRAAELPVMFLSAHVGSFYAQYAALGDTGYPLHVIARAVSMDPTSSLAKSWAERLNYRRHGERSGGEYLYISPSGRCGRNLARVLNAREWLIAYLDVPSHSSHTSHALPLLGQVARLPAGAVERAVARGYSFVTVWSHYVIAHDGLITRVIEIDPPLARDLDFSGVLAEYGKRLSVVAMKHSEQWLGRRILPILFPSAS